MGTPQQAMAEALDRLWKQHHPQIVERVSQIESATRALQANELSKDQQGQANAAAHKLAGVLGTFGLTKGTVLAREAELLYAGDAEPDPGSVPRLHEIASELKVLVSSRK
ncbi:Hpt domain-containing protein [Acidobacteria bacterium AB60]|nr:Hpt domain-containing protein [Acidobacteria bacterium AB60]